MICDTCYQIDMWCLKGCVFYKLTLTLHVLQFGTVGGEEGENSLRFPVTVDVKLQVGQHDAMTEKKRLWKLLTIKENKFFLILILL